MSIGAISSHSRSIYRYRIYDKMLAFPELTILIIMPVIAGMIHLFIEIILRVLPLPNDQLSKVPFALSIIIFALGFQGLVYSFYPYIVPGHLHIIDASASIESLSIS